jgi:hypothetical protein
VGDQVGVGVGLGVVVGVTDGHPPLEGVGVEMVPAAIVALVAEGVRTRHVGVCTRTLGVGVADGSAGVGGTGSIPTGVAVGGGGVDVAAGAVEVGFGDAEGAGDAFGTGVGVERGRGVGVAAVSACGRLSGGTSPWWGPEVEGGRSGSVAGPNAVDLPGPLGGVGVLVGAWPAPRAGVGVVPACSRAAVCPDSAAAVVAGSSWV